MHSNYDWDKEWRDVWDETLAFTFTLVYWDILPWGSASDLNAYLYEYSKNNLAYMKESGVGTP